MWVQLLWEIPGTSTKTVHPAVLVRNIIWDMTVGSYPHHLHTHTHIPSGENYAEMIRISVEQYLFSSPVGLSANHAAWPN